MGARLKLIVMSIGAFAAMLYVVQYVEKTWAYRHPQNKVANALVAVG